MNFKSSAFVIFILFLHSDLSIGLAPSFNPMTDSMTGIQNATDKLLDSILNEHSVTENINLIDSTIEDNEFEELLNLIRIENYDTNLSTSDRIQRRDQIAQYLEIGTIKILKKQKLLPNIASYTIVQINKAIEKTESTLKSSHDFLKTAYHHVKDSHLYNSSELTSVLYALASHLSTKKPLNLQEFFNSMNFLVDTFKSSDGEVKISMASYLIDFMTNSYIGNEAITFQKKDGTRPIIKYELDSARIYLLLILDQYLNELDSSENSQALRIKMKRFRPTIEEIDRISKLRATKISEPNIAPIQIAPKCSEIFALN